VQTDLDAERHHGIRQHERHERTENLGSKIAITPHGLGGEEGVRPGAKFHKLHPGQAPLASLLLKRESESFTGEEGGVGYEHFGRLTSCSALGNGPPVWWLYLYHGEVVGGGERSLR
jgi:hypothetical protein